ncbi:TetR/AcrR family transcriptional regulator [Pendulispora rubella]|uniref:TetR/AcrR family transcriptional regulator n=1 Tax=Pendulispora rubella TaxID=2741070 RepID=A0ABZ2L8F2_9BACT
MNLDDVAPLPRGRHRLSRNDVITSQRDRMLAAMAAAVAEKGYVRTSVADVLRGARVSRETFYEQFADKEACFMAAYESAAELTLNAMSDAARNAAGEPVERFGEALEAYLQTLASEPTLARTFLIEIYAAGPQAIARRVELQHRFVDLTANLFGARSKQSRFACEALIAAISSLVTSRLGTGNANELAALHTPLMELVRRMLRAPESAAPAPHRARRKKSSR